MIAPAVLAAALVKPKTNANPTLQPTALPAGGGQIDPSLIAAQLQAQQVGSQLQANQQAGNNLRGGVGEFLPRMLAQALLQGQSKSSNTALSQAQMNHNTAVAKALFPNDSQAQLAYLTDPSDMAKSFASRYAPQDVRAGNTLLNAPPSAAGSQGSAPGTYTAPKMDVTNDRPTIQTMGGMQTGAQLPMGYQEQTAAAGQQETARQDQAVNALTQQGLGIQQEQANAAKQQAAAAAQQAASGAQTSNVGASNSQNFNLPPGYVLKGP